jgi:ankyrin repeat domain-containing protein 50
MRTSRLTNLKATVQCQTPTTKASPLTEAAKRGRSDLIEELIERGASVVSRDGQKRSALYHSSKNRDLKTVSFLLGRGALRNDGSIHVAAKFCHTEAIAMLLEAGVDANHLHKGKTALAQLCHKYQPRGVGWEETVRESMRLLFNNRADPTMKLKKHDGKTALHLALENGTCSVQILEALFEYPEVAKRVDEDIFRFKDSRGLLYSPTKYLELRIEGIPSSTKHELIGLLHDQNCEDRYYNPAGPQPEGFCGLPPHLEETVQRDATRDWEFQQQIRRQHELTQTEMRNIKQKHRLTIELGNQMEIVGRDREERKQESTLRHSQQKHLQDMTHMSERNQMQIEHESNLRSSELAHSEALSLQRQKEQQAILEMGHQRLAYQENAAIQNHKREREMIEYQTEHVKIRAKEMKAVAASARTANVPQHLLTQGMSYTSLPSPD